MTQARQQRAAAVQADPRWQQVLARDPQADGRFYYAVSTTGVYCRPSCASRTARPEHVSFHASAEAAQAAGFRPCRRCKPDAASQAQQQAALVAAACRRIDAAERTPELAELAAQARLSPFHFHRMFKAVTGLTPAQYARTRRAERLREGLARSDSVTQAMLDAGYASSSRFYEQAQQELGMPAKDYRRGGAHQRLHFAVGQCSLGAVLVASSARGICAILIGDDPQALVDDLQRRFARAELCGGDAAYERLVAQVIGFIEAPTPRFELPLDVRGTVFQQKVWQALQQIPPGTTLSYRELAERIGEPRAVRAVAQACGANAHAVAIPCHRIVRHDGGLSGYRWGVERKRALLERERQAPP